MKARNLKSEMKLEIKNSLGEVYYKGEYFEKDDLLYARWTGFLSSEEIIAAAKKGMEVFDPFKYSKLLTNGRDVIGSWDEANKWLAKNWIPKAVENGLKQFAFIVPADFFALMSAEDLETKIPANGFAMRTFDSEEEARIWLGLRS